MILAHLSDLHLGFRGHGRRERGHDARERDVLEVLERAVAELVELGPHVVVVTGDVFDRPDPDPAVLLALTRALGTLRTGLPDVAVALLAGPRDVPLGFGEPGPLDVLASWPSVWTATSTARSLRLAGGALHLAMVPHGALVHEPARGPAPAPVPDPNARHNVLAIHGRVVRAEGGRGRRRRGLSVDPGEWDYVALGGEHAHREVGGNTRYAGSLERIGWSPWIEALEEKGFVTVDLKGGRAVFHPLPVRPVVALAPIRVPRGDKERLLGRVREVTAEVPGGIDGRIVRLRLQGPGPDDLRALQDGLLEELRARALHLGLGVEEAEDVGGGDLAGRLATLLEDEGADPAGAAALLPEAPATGLDAPAPTTPFVVRAGGASLRLPPRGLVALVGREPRERSALGRALREAEEGGGAPPPSASALLDVAARRVAGPELDVVEAVLARVRRGAAKAGTPPVDARVPRGALEAVSGELRALEREMAALRADDVEVGGDVEQAAMEWTRERQDAETQLQAYRDRARELKARLRQLEAAGEGTPCPTCGRPLADHFDEVVATLRDEWEDVVQDGRWWKRRREQLEEKPAALRELEGAALRLHAALEACSERVERARARMEGPDPVAREADAEGWESPTPGAPGPSSPTARALARLRDERLDRARTRAILRASRVVEQITGGRVVFLSLGGDGAPVPQGPSGALDDPADEEAAAIRLALRAVAASARPLPSLTLPEGTLEALSATDALRAVDVLRALLRSVPRILLVTDGRVVDRRPEAFDHALELEGEGSGARARPLGVGTGAVALASRATAPSVHGGAGR